MEEVIQELRGASLRIKKEIASVMVTETEEIDIFGIEVDIDSNINTVRGDYGKRQLDFRLTGDRLYIFGPGLYRPNAMEYIEKVRKRNQHIKVVID